MYPLKVVGDCAPEKSGTTVHFLPDKDIFEDTAIGDIVEWDSLHHIQIISAIEKEFDFRFTLDVMLELEDVSDIINAVEERVAK